MRARIVGIAVVIAVAAATPLGARAQASGGGAAIDCANWRYTAADEPRPGVLPSEYDRNNYKRTSLRDPRPELADSPHNQCGQKGIAADLAWGVTQGRDDVTIAVLDSGIRWRDANSMRDLATKVHINLAEATPPCGTAYGGDCNGDGRFDITDFGAIGDRNGNGLADPEDLILDPVYNNGVDDDHDGYVDDIAGWDFLYGDNDPLDTVDYGHGTGEAEDSTAAANGVGNVGTCPECRVLPVRVGDSFIADAQRFAAGVLFALDSHVAVVQEALGVINNPSAAQRVIDAAYERGVVVVASMADEASKHPNLPAALDHTMAVNSVTEQQPPLSNSVDGYLALNGCTNYGGHTFVSVESGACSSEATGISSGVVGLIESEARTRGVQLTANEAMQIVRTGADDVDFSTPNAHDPANDFGTSTGGLLDTVRYPSRPGWDATFGYGRLNAYEAVKAVRDGRIPPEADITRPKWFTVLPVTGAAEVRGRVAAPRSGAYDYRVEWAAGVQPPEWPQTDVWHAAGGATNVHGARSGVLGTLDLAAIAHALPNNGTGAPLDANGRPDEEKFSARVRIVVTAHGGSGDGLQGIDQQQIFVHDDPDLVAGYPARERGAGTASPVFAQIDGHGGKELVLGTDDGVIHALRSDGSEAPGWPVRTQTAAWWPTHSPTAAAAHIDAPGAAIPVGGPSFGDIDGDGRPEVVSAALDGRVYAWHTNGQLLAGFPVGINPAFSRDTPGPHDQYNRTKPAIVGSAALGDLDGDHELDIVVAAADRHVYAWHGNGRPVAGFPVLVVDPATVQSVDPVTHAVQFTAASNVHEGGELIATPALGDLDGDGHPDIVIGAQEEYAEPANIGDGADVLALLGAIGQSGNARLYAISSKGTLAHGADTNPAHPDEQAYLPGWPAKLGMLALESLPTLGDGVAIQAAIGDANPKPGPEVLAASAAGPLYVLDAHAQSVFGKGTNGMDLPLAWTGGLDGSLLTRFGAHRTTEDLVATSALFSGGALARLRTSDHYVSAAAPTAGLTRLIDIQASDLQLPNDDQLIAWNTQTTGNATSGFPRATSDMAFFVTPAVADLNGDGRREVIAGNGIYMLNAYDPDGRSPAGWPKLTGGWMVGTPGLGDWDGDGHLELAAVRRDGTLIVWHTQGPVSQPGAWLRYGGNDRNAGGS